MYRRSADIESLNAGLAWLAPDRVTRIELGPSVEGREISAIRVGRGGQKSSGVLFVGGIHARELLNPDLLIEAAMNLLYHEVTQTDWVLGGQTWLAVTLQVILDSIDIYILANANPDGREHVLDGDRLWRKNRAPLEGTTCIGVDLNRNFDLLWGIETRDQMGNLTTSRSPCNYQFVGPNAFSEPETQNVRRLLDDYPIECFVDVHSFSELILHPWGHAPNQTVDPTQRFNVVDTSGWNLLPNDAPSYREYIDRRDLERFEEIGNAAVRAIRNVRGRTYTLEQGQKLYPTTGTASDYAYSRHIADSTRRKVYGLTFETGPRVPSVEDSFQPPVPEADRIKEEATSGLISVLTSLVCAVDLIGSDLAERAAEPLRAMRRVRDDRLVATEPGGAWVQMLNRHQLELARLAVEDANLRKEGAELIGEVGNLIRKNGVLSSEATERAVRFAVRVGKATRSDELRRDLDLVKRVLPQLADRRAADITDYLASTPPRRQHERAPHQ
jgi:murein tripeptide amidase MpaA